MVAPTAAIAALYTLAAMAIAGFAAHQVWLAAHRWLRPPVDPPRATHEGVPLVTVQLPVYNERTSIRPLLAAVARLDWPRDRLQVQLLDDSTDETPELAATPIARMRAAGLAVQHLRRTDRQGYKAGALAHGLTRAEGELIAIFDADFRPRPDFLHRTIEAMGPTDGLVQARWVHPHADRSWQTALQAFQLDHHFTVEQGGRHAGGGLPTFNGTAGVWRRQAITDAGGWRADSLTEDLDLSLRAWLCGWRVRYVEAVTAPAELPRDLRAVRTQQVRWMKGGAQAARLLLGDVWRSDLPLRHKLATTAHLLGSSAYVAVLVLALVAPLLAPLRHGAPAAAAWFAPADALLQVSTIALAAAYATTSWLRADLASPLRFILAFPGLIALSVGMSLQHTVAVAEGWAGRDTPFVRTVKRGDRLRPYERPDVPSIVWGELVLATWCAVGAVVALRFGSPVGCLFGTLQAAGFAVFALGTWLPSRDPRVLQAQHTHG